MITMFGVVANGKAMPEKCNDALEAEAVAFRKG